MMKLKILAGLVFCAQSFSAHAFACDQVSSDSLLLSESTQDFQVCESSTLLNSKPASAQQPTSIYLPDEKEAGDDSYWSGFAFTNTTDPILTTQVDNNFLGFGVWLPEDLEEFASEMKTDEWLLSHGLQLSLGIGSQRGKEPRMRVDYRWHQEFAPDVMFQLELPF